MSTLNTVTPNVAATAIDVALSAGRVPFLWGSPGIGKSDTVRRVAKAQSRDLIDVRVSQWDAVDSRGVPYVTEGRTTWAIPSIFPTDPESTAIIFLDELNSAPKSVIAACYQLILDRRLGDYQVPEGVSIIAAGNQIADRAIVNDIGTAAKNRFSPHLKLTVDNAEWESWALDADIALEIIMFLRLRPELLHAWDPKSHEEAQPTPRSWEFASDLLKKVQERGINGEVEAALLSGTIGEGAASELISFLKIYRSIPDPQMVINDPKAAPIPDEVSALYALCGSLASRSTKENFDNVLAYASRLQPEFETLLVVAATRKHDSLQHTKGFLRWAVKNGEALNPS